MEADVTGREALCLEMLASASAKFQCARDVGHSGLHSGLLTTADGGTVFAVWGHDSWAKWSGPGHQATHGRVSAVVS